MGRPWWPGGAPVCVAAGRPADAPQQLLNNCAECWLLRAAPPLRPCSSPSARPTAHRRACANPPPLTAVPSGQPTRRQRSSFGAVRLHPYGAAGAVRVSPTPLGPARAAAQAGPVGVWNLPVPVAGARSPGGPLPVPLPGHALPHRQRWCRRAANAPGHRRWAGRLPGPRGRRAARRGQILQEEARCRVQKERNRHPRGFIQV
jgi:hypothetical protein